MPVQNFEWVKVVLSNSFTFFTKDFFFNEKIVNQVGQYGVRFFPPSDSEYYTIHNQTADKIMLKKDATFGFNPNMICNYHLVRDKAVEVV